MKKIILILTIFASFTTVTKAQKNISHNNQQWIQYYNQLNFSPKFSLLTDISFRRLNGFSKWSQISFRTGIGYPVKKNLQGVSGVACFTFYTNNKLDKIEFRSYQEVNTTKKTGKVSTQHRIRVEARYFRKISEGDITSLSTFNFRFRYKFFCGIPLIKLSKSNPDRKILLNIGDEIFINAGKEIIYNRFDNNRILVGSTFQINKNLNLSFIYNYQLGQRNNKAAYEHSDIFWLGINQIISLKHD